MESKNASRVAVCVFQGSIGKKIASVPNYSAKKSAGPAGQKRPATSSDLDYVFGKLKQSMMMGQFVPGQKLKLGELAGTFGTSHMPVREALHRLAMVQALETAPRRSPSVPKANRKHLRDILSLRIDLESKAARLALENDDGTLAKSMHAVNEMMNVEGAKREPRIQKYLELNQQFHFEIYRRSDNDVLLNLIELLWMRYGPLLNLISAGGGLSFEHSQHSKMIEAVERKDAGALIEAISNDLTSAAIAIERRIPGTRST